MNKAIKILSAIAFTIATVFGMQGAKTVKIKLTGSSYEKIHLTVGQTGRTETIQSLPYTLEVTKEELPIRLSFKSDHYLYYDIDVPEKPIDTTGHVYLVKINETAMTLQAQKSHTLLSADNSKNGEISTADDDFDTSEGVNSAPFTGMKNEKTFALIIANEEYEMAAKVENAKNDGLAFKEYCIKTLGLPTENVRYAPNLSYGKMRKTINDAIDLVNVLKGEGSLIIYYAGHGIPDNATKDAFLMPVDAEGTDCQVCISLKDFYSRINAASMKQCIVFLDACFSGAQRGGDMIVSARAAKLKPKEAKPTGHTIVFSATSGEQAAYSHKNERHGLFTYYLLKRLQETKGDVKLGELSDYLREKVELESRRINNAPQTPTVSVSTSLENTWKNLRLAQ